MLKTASSFVLGSSKSSAYPRGYASGFDSPAALPEDRFEHPSVSRIAPTVSLKLFVFRHDDESAIRESLKEPLYIQAVDKKSKTDKFRINAHGLFAAV
jgi:hypothetical protein